MALRLYEMSFQYFLRLVSFFSRNKLRLLNQCFFFSMFCSSMPIQKCLSFRKLYQASTFTTFSFNTFNSSSLFCSCSVFLSNSMLNFSLVLSIFYISFFRVRLSSSSTLLSFMPYLAQQNFKAACNSFIISFFSPIYSASIYRLYFFFLLQTYCRLKFYSICQSDCFFWCLTKINSCDSSKTLLVRFFSFSRFSPQRKRLREQYDWFLLMDLSINCIFFYCSVRILSLFPTIASGELSKNSFLAVWITFLMIIFSIVWTKRYPLWHLLSRSIDFIHPNASASLLRASTYSEYTNLALTILFCDGYDELCSHPASMLRLRVVDSCDLSLFFLSRSMRFRYLSIRFYFLMHYQQSLAASLGSVCIINNNCSIPPGWEWHYHEKLTIDNQV